jgi:hypothetical protein
MQVLFERTGAGAVPGMATPAAGDPARLAARAHEPLTRDNLIRWPELLQARSRTRWWTRRRSPRSRDLRVHPDLI